MLRKQLKKVNDDYRAAKRQLDDLNAEKGTLDDRAHELQLENDVVARTLRNTIKGKEEAKYANSVYSNRVARSLYRARAMLVM